jgi:hypothetical protein
MEEEAMLEETKRRIIFLDREDYIITYSGIKFFPFDPRIEDIKGIDIVHCLANKCRFGGHRQFYSVAQHCTLGAEYAPKEFKKDFFMHDASEAYFWDIPKPLKSRPEFKEQVKAQKYLQLLVCEKFGLQYPLPDIVKEIDQRMLATEKRDLKVPYRDSCTYLESFPGKIVPWGPRLAKKLFLNLFIELFGDEALR